VYLTDRLGMPLIETVTAPDMRTPQESAEVCQIVRQVLPQHRAGSHRVRRHAARRQRQCCRRYAD